MCSSLNPRSINLAVSCASNKLLSTAALDQPGRKVGSVAVIPQVGKKMGRGQLRLQRLALDVRQLAPEEFAEVEANPDPIDSDETRDVLDVIDITIKRRLLFLRTNENGVDPDDAARRGARPGSRRPEPRGRA